MTPLGWRWALFLWGYALAWFLVNDRVKLLAYRIFDRPDAQLKANAKTKAVPESDAKAPPVSKPTAKPDANAGLNADVAANTPVDLTSRIAKRAYKLYEEGGRKDGAAVQNWQKAESEIRQNLAKSEPAHEAYAEPIAVAKVEPKPDSKDRPQPVGTVELQREAQADTPSEVSPQLVKRVHALYEELGRQDVQTVLDWEQAKGKIRKE
jgi:H+-transporting ATPase